MMDYDRHSVVELSKQVNHPAWEYIATLMRCDAHPGWVVPEGDR